MRAVAQKQEQAAQQAPRRQSTTRRLAKKIVAPIRVTWAELGNSIEFFKASWRHLGSFGDDASAPLSEAPLIRTGFGVDVNRAPAYSIGTKEPAAVNGPVLFLYELSAPAATMDGAPAATESAAQLKVRIRSEWTMLYEVSRPGVSSDRDDVGVGLGLRFEF